MAIHLLSADERGKFAPNSMILTLILQIIAESHLRPVFSSQVYNDLTGLKHDEKLPPKHYAQLYELLKSEANVNPADILDLDFYLTDT